MAEELFIPQRAGKEEMYEAILPQMRALTDKKAGSVANVANLMAVLKTAFHFWWVGVYMIEKEELILGPFQGPVACTRIAKSKGVCGTAWERKETIIVDNVEQFPGHIACSSATRSEIVVPVFRSNEIIGVLDVDSEHIAHFDHTDKKYLERIAGLIAEVWL